MVPQNITLSNGLEFSLIKFNSGFTSEEIRLFYPNWKQVLNSPDFFDPIKTKYKDNPEIVLLLINLIEYYKQSTLSPQGMRRKYHPYDKLTRKFKLDSLLYLPEFNNKLRNILTQQSPNNFFKYIRKLSNKEKKIQRDQIVEDMVKGNRSIEDKTIEELISVAFLDEIKEDHPYTPRGQVGFIAGELKKIKEVIKFFSSQSSDYTKSNFESVKKILEGKPINKKLYSDETIKSLIKEADILLKKFDWVDNPLRKYPYAKSILPDGSPDGYDDTEALRILDKIVERLNEIKKKENKSENKEIISGIISTINENKKLPIEFRWLSLITIKNQLADQVLAKKFLLRELENQFRFCIRENEKKHLKLLIKEQKLTKPEIRLYIMHNIGVKKLNYMTPLFEPPLYQSLEFSRLGISVFLEVVINRNKIQGLDLDESKRFLELIFKLYLVNYKIIIEIIRDDERAKKKNHYKSKLSRSKEGIDSEIDDQIEDEQAEEDESKEQEYLPEIEHITESIAKSNPFMNEPVSNDSHMDYIDFKSNLMNVLGEEEFKLFYKLFYEDKSEEEISKQFGVSQQTINKRKKAILKKLQNNKLFKSYSNKNKKFL